MKDLKKYISIAFALFVSGMTMTSCDDFLTEDPKSYIKPETFYSTKTEVEIGLAGMYSVLASDNVFGQALIQFDAGADEGYYNRRGNDNWSVSLYRHTASDVSIANLWAALYNSINLANLFMENLSTGFPEDEYNRYLAEARFIRGFSYLNLTSWFEEVPIRKESSKDQSYNHVEAASLAEIYDFIKDDLLFAAEYLYHSNDKEYTPGRANKMAAHGLLARMYLKRAGYPLQDKSAYKLAREHCDIIMTDGWHDLMQESNGENGYRRHFLNYVQNTYDTKESLFEISFGYLRQMGLMVNGRVGGLNGLRFILAGGTEGPSSYSMLNASPVLTNSYDDSDVRKAWNVPGMQYNEGNIARQGLLEAFYCPGKFRRWEPQDYNDIDIPNQGKRESYILLEKASEQNYNFTCVNSPVLRYSDVLLMFAEADNEVNDGPSQAAIDALDKVRNRAGLPDADAGITGSKEAFFNELVIERMRELCFEGIRRHDLVRWGKLKERLDYQKTVIQGTAGFVATNDQHVSYLRSANNFNPAKHLSLPYPLQEVTINKKLNQKPEWAGSDK
ncbi:RagB/SusD family nutrient uptake outer membrane protein [Dysgonomonas sp. 511]|uniref:RagB/SusD family nutrient uptake outer membrane protein n=1 Tax=Dysgonomonas sp. 511 TaxID=2302930 RepID=UPI0013D33991|nr:RagB/SusD family nutrient uptake outer membrane protein [Dysgonomonas sp. 511]NDV78778.1 RagB/SusD family nutrient uptake outer membrane protein [Dysgonomonas sp. 511]